MNHKKPLDLIFVHFASLLQLLLGDKVDQIRQSVPEVGHTAAT
jgi:hypothetical protein